MLYEAPDFIKVVANVNDSFSSSPSIKCRKSKGFLHVDGEYFGNTQYLCGGPEIWTETEYAANCWTGNVEE